MQNYVVFPILIFVAAIANSDAQSEVTLPFSSLSLRQILRTKTTIPKGRKAALSDVRLLLYGNSSSYPTTYRFSNIKQLLLDINFDLEKNTALYAHGYVEVSDDESVQTIVDGYNKHGRYNLVIIDWANFAFGSYISAANNVQKVGKELGRCLSKLVASGALQVTSLHLVGHSLGAHLVAHAARFMAAKGFTVPRLTGLDPALPGFYQPLDQLGKPMSPEDATFVDVIHTDGGKYGTPLRSGHADFWPNGGSARQPGCPINSVPFTYEDFCSHWMSWRLYAESVAGGQFTARPCQEYDTFLRGSCAPGDLAAMGLNAPTHLRGNFYLRTAASSPYALGDRGAE